MRRLLLSVVAIVGAPAAFAEQPGSIASSSAVPAKPAAHAIAARIVSRLLPDGTYRKMMSGTFDKMMASVMDQMTALPINELVAMAGVPEEKVRALGPGTVKQLVAIVDPAFEQRMQITTKVMMDDMINLMSTMEPSVREGLTQAYVNRFTEAQLAELDRFFATPTGSLYAEQSMQVYTDPAVMSRMQTMIPEMMKAMPAIIKRVVAATEGLPKPRKANDLTKADKQKLAELLGINPEEMK